MGGPLITVGAGADGKLDKNAGIVLNAQGHGEATIGPVPGGQVWRLTRMTVSCTGANNPMPTCSVYDGPASPTNLVDATYTGGQDVSDFGVPYELRENESLLFVWNGGVPGTRATARLIGTQGSA